MFFVILLIGVLVLAALPLMSRPKERSRDSEPKHRPDARFFRRQSITPSTENWIKTYLADCESAAEEAFLRAMVSAFSLVPADGLLVGSGIQLNQQVEVKRAEVDGSWRVYRVDFLVDDWLVVEIDGAAYHSSLEALQKDSTRDAFLRRSGYTTLHLPAKLVFTAPEDAITRVRAAVAKKPALPPASASRPEKISFLQIIDENMNLSRKGDEAAALSGISNFYAATRLIDAVIKLEETEMEIEEQGYSEISPRQNMDKLRICDFVLSSAKSDIANNSLSAQKYLPNKYLMDPESHQDPYIAELLIYHQQSMRSEVPYYFKIAQAKLRKNPTLAERVDERLRLLGCVSCVTAIRAEYE